MGGAIVSLSRTMPLLLACSCGGREALPIPPEECALASATVVRLGGPSAYPFTDLTLDGDGNAFFAHGLSHPTRPIEGHKEHYVHHSTTVHTLDPDGCIETITISDPFRGFTAGTAGTWFAADEQALVELSTAGERLATWTLVEKHPRSSGWSVDNRTPVALPAGGAMVCTGIEGNGGDFLGTPLTELGAIHIAIFSPDSDEPVARVFPVTEGDALSSGSVRCKAVRFPDGRVVAIASVDGTLDVDGEEIAAVGALLWLELDEELEVLSAHVLDDVSDWLGPVHAGPDGTVYLGGGDASGGVVARLGRGGDAIWRASLGSAWPTVLGVEPSGDVQYIAVATDDSQPAGAPPSRTTWGRVTASGVPGAARTIVRSVHRDMGIALAIDGSGRTIIAGELNVGDHLELEGAMGEAETEDGMFLARYEEQSTPE
jgi:hypothetical protein